MDHNQKEEKLVLITGGSLGLGKFTAFFLKNLGYKVLVTTRRDIESSVHYTVIKSSIETKEDINSLLKKIYSKYGKIYAWIHAAGPFIRERKHFIDYNYTEINHMLNGNLLNSLFLSKEILSHMRAQKEGRVIFFGFSRVDQLPAWPDRSLYAAFKSALASFTKSVAVEEAPFGITVNMVCPGDIRDHYKEMQIEESEIEILDENKPYKRLSVGEDVSRVIAFLLSPDSDFITGSIIDVNGGMDIINTNSKIITE